jgi:hypothetical protein
MTQDWQLDPQGHKFRSAVVNFDVHGVTEPFPTGECQLCGQAQALHTGARIPTDQVLRALPETLAPRLPL